MAQFWATEIGTLLDVPNSELGVLFLAPSKMPLNHTAAIGLA
jgi:hypothetical protein